MEIYSFIYFFIGALACTIGAIPFGLVNLSVVESTLNNNTRQAMNIAHGASVVEVLFALASLRLELGCRATLAVVLLQNLSYSQFYYFLGNGFGLKKIIRPSNPTGEVQWVFLKVFC